MALTQYGFTKTMFVWMLLFFGCYVAGSNNFDAKLEPGHVKQEFDSVEEVRGHNETTTDSVVEDEHLLGEAILDVAYYLRRFKFSGCDPRPITEEENPKKNFYVEFPSPPLKNIHWEVKKNCEPSFVKCVKYLQQQVSQTVLPRRLDSLTITKQNRWSFAADRDLIKSADDKCQKLLEKDEKTFHVFSGPLQKFHWLTTASYYMCFYALKGTGYLKYFMDDCDNFASCIHWNLGLNNKDVRGNNEEPFACALYSFCPDPCCPLKYISDSSACLEVNPCSLHSSEKKNCWFLKEQNMNFDSLLLNQWNVSCHCDKKGMRWESKSGMCVDIDECLEIESACEIPSETCKNLPGSYRCSCNMMGYQRNPETTICEKNPNLHHLFYAPHSSQSNKTKSFLDKFYDAVNKFKFTPLSSLAISKIQSNSSISL